ncbi:hypothetical protein F2Q69_00053072 [Brassica cretica]|uniref:Uncharacterized protein n=1 Tax=Brassica cretica TaxID=69181 RepID=A0A8S9N0H6_BRACR|nr:hypothetical protein F2Q69_00053072 [Brassica cretica]
MPSSTRSNKETHLLFSEDPAYLEHSIREDQRSTSLDAAAFTSTDSLTHPSTNTRPSSSTDLHRSTSIVSTLRTLIDHQSRSVVAIVILRQDENGNLPAQPVEEAAPLKALADYNRPDEYYANRSAIRLPEISKENFKLKPPYYTLVSQIPYYGLPHKHPSRGNVRQDLLSCRLVEFGC